MTKFPFAFAAFVALVGFGTLGCGGDDCEDGAERVQAKLEECDVEIPETTEGAAEELECTDERAEQAQNRASCFEAAECPAIRNEDVAGATVLGECLAQ